MIIDDYLLWQCFWTSLAMSVLLLAMMLHTAECRSRDGYEDDLRDELAAVARRLDNAYLDVCKLSEQAAKARAAPVVKPGGMRAKLLCQKALLDGWIEVSGCSRPEELSKRLKAKGDEI